MGLVYPDDPYVLDTEAPYKRAVGHEYEYASGASLAQWLAEQGTGTPPSRNGGGYIHGYHCNCEHRDDFFVHPTQDGTASGGEYLIGGSNGVVFGSEPYVSAIKALADGVLVNRNDVSNGVGGHIHVDAQDLELHEKRNVLRNYVGLENQIHTLAAMADREPRNNGNVRSRLHSPEQYVNSHPEFWTCDSTDLNFSLPGRPTLNFGSRTIEFRVWNSTRADWRMYMAAGVSSALVQASADGHVVNGPDSVDLLDFLDGYLTDDVVALVVRQRLVQGLSERVVHRMAA